MTTTKPQKAIVQRYRAYAYIIGPDQYGFLSQLWRKELTVYIRPNGEHYTKPPRIPVRLHKDGNYLEVQLHITGKRGGSESVRTVKRIALTTPIHKG